MNRSPLPPFTAETAAQKVRMAEDAWNRRVALAYPPDSRWHNRVELQAPILSIQTAFRSPCQSI